MAKLALVYGVRMLPVEDLEAFEDATVTLKNGKTARVTMHVIEGENEEELKGQLYRSLDAFFDFYPEL